MLSGGQKAQKSARRSRFVPPHDRSGTGRDLLPPPNRPRGRILAILKANLVSLAEKKHRFSALAVAEDENTLIVKRFRQLGKYEGGSGRDFTYDSLTTWTWPSFIGIRRSAAWATSWLWVTITSVSFRESRRW
jgi:hypothetical protein